MDSGVAALIGATLGSLVAMTGTYLTTKNAAKLEHRQWIRHKREEAYTQSVRSLLKVKNSRSAVTVEGKAVLDKSDTKEWFGHCIDVLHWIRQISVYSRKHYEMHGLDDRLEKFETTMDKLFSGDARFLTDDLASGAEVTFIAAVADSLLHAVTNAANEDIGSAILGLGPR